MKFMKKDTAEAAAVTGVVTHLALSHPEVSVKLIRDGAEVLHTPGDGQLRSAVYAALGRDFAWACCLSTAAAAIFPWKALSPSP